MSEDNRIEELLERLSRRNSKGCQAFHTEETFRRNLHDRLVRRRHQMARGLGLMFALVISVFIFWKIHSCLRYVCCQALVGEIFANADADISYAPRVLNDDRIRLGLKVFLPTGECIESLVFSISDNDYIVFSSKRVTGELFASHLAMTESPLDLAIDIVESDELSLHIQDMLSIPCDCIEKQYGKYRISLKNLSSSVRRVTDNTKFPKFSRV